MKTSFWKWFGLVLISLPIGCYTAFVAECFWNWFAVPVVHVSNVSFLQMLGIIWLIQVITARPTDSDNKRWVLLFDLLELCVPPEKLPELEGLKKPDSINVFLEGFSMATGQIASNTLMLVLGFALHLFV
jgi:hypothetical protein